MKALLTRILTSILVFSFFIAPTAVFADTYGSGSYGNCTYGNGCMTGSKSLASTLSSAGKTITSLFCTDQAPSRAPNLQQIEATSTSAKLQFAPAGEPYNKHIVSYGLGNNSEDKQADFTISTDNEKITYEVSQLTPGTVYTFKVQGSNGCKPGPWSDTLTIKTQLKDAKSTATFNPKQQASYVQATPASWTTQAKTFINDLIPN